MKLTEAERMALILLTHAADCIGPIDDEPKLAAALTYAGLNTRGLTYPTPSDRGPVWNITEAGRQALAAASQGGGEHA